MSPNHDPENETRDRAEGAQPPGSRTQLTPVGFEQRLLARARAAGLGLGDRVIVAFSGGRDSLALAAGLRRVRDVLGVELLLVHVDHLLRAESGEEAARAAMLAQRLSLPFTSRALKLSPSEIHPHVGVEEAARRERYGVLFEAASEIGARAVATGHHEADQAETVLLHLLRGSGVHGAAGMREWGGAPYPSAASRDISPKMGRPPACEVSTPRGREPALWRPLLREPRSAIGAYADCLGLPWIEDASNTDVSFRRNAIRHEVMPLLEARFPGATAALARYADLAAADDDALQRMTGEALEGGVDPGGRLRVAAFAEQPLGMRRRIVRGWLARAVGAEEISASRIDAVTALAQAGRGGSCVEIGRGWTVCLRRGMLSAERWRDDRQGGAMGDEPRADGVARILIDAGQIRERTAEMAKVLDAEYGYDVPLLVGVLNGAVTFMTDLMRAMTIPLEIDFMAVSSYGAATQSSGVVRILKDLDREIEGRRVVVVEDIVDSGLTLQYLLDVLGRRNPRDLRVVALLKKDKPDALEVAVDEIGFTIPDEFVIGYGLDYAGKYRNLPYVAVLDPRMYAGE